MRDSVLFACAAPATATGAYLCGQYAMPTLELSTMPMETVRLAHLTLGAGEPATAGRPYPSVLSATRSAVRLPG